MKRLKDIKKILVFKLCCLGDIVFMTPSIAALKKNFPAAQIYLIASQWVERLIPYLKNIDEVIIYDAPLKGGFFYKFFSFINLVGKLRKQRFDLAFLGHRANVFGLVLKLSGIKYRLGFRGTRFLNCTAEFDGDIHETERYLNILKKNGIETDSASPELKQDRVADDIQKEYNIPTNKFIVGIFPFGGINPGTKMDIKRWDYERFEELIRKTAETFPEVVILMFEGSEANEKVDSRFRPDQGYGTGRNDKYDNVRIMKINIDLISVCNIFISGDTGPLHIAGALDVSTLTIFGPSNPELVKPLSKPVGKTIRKFVWKKPVCSPCYTPATAIDRNNTKYWRADDFVCYVGTHVCMKEISVEDVFGALEEMINEVKRIK
jgi:heptosyltransferase-2